MSDYAGAVVERTPVNWKRVIFLVLGIFLFAAIYYSPPWPDAVDPMGKHFILSREGKGALAVFCWPAPGGCSRCCPSASPASRSASFRPSF